MAHLPILRLPRPKAFLYLMSLRTGTELITLSLLVNKLTGLYGLLALFAGLHLSPLQLSMYIYSVGALVLAAYLAPHIRLQSPLQCLALAWFYALDSLVNAAYTAAFGIAWFVVLAEHHQHGSGAGAAGAGKTMHEAAGFARPAYNVSEVQVAASGQDGAQPVGHGGGSNANAGFFQSGSAASLSVIVALLVLRVYFILVVMAYARAVLRQHIVVASWQPGGGGKGGSDKLAEDPFAVGKEDGAGWKGGLGRAMVAVAEGYWLGADEETQWVPAAYVGGNKGRTGGAAPGTVERERRRRAGTGPPAVSGELKTELLGKR